MGARNQVGIELSYRPARLRSFATQFQTRFLLLIPRPIAVLKLFDSVFDWYNQREGERGGRFEYREQYLTSLAGDGVEGVM